MKKSTFAANLQQHMRFIFFTLLSFSFFSCTEDNDLIPNVYVNFNIQLNSAEFSNLQAVGNSEYVTGGVKGIILYRYDFDTFLAFDRACSFRPSIDCERVKIDNKTGTTLLTDSCCGSKFLITDGYPIEGSALLPLKRYNTSFDGENISVFN